MIKQKLAEMLNGMQYNSHIDMDIIELAKSFGYVIIYGHSDDLMEICGAIDGEVNCFEGGEAYFLHSNLLEFVCGEEYPECPYIQKCIKDAHVVKAIWDNGEYAWTYETTIPHVTFDIMEDEEKYCRGIIFDINDIR